MNNETLWAMAFVAVLGMRLHPKNDEYGTIEDAINVAKEAADRAVKEQEKKSWAEQH